MKQQIAAFVAGLIFAAGLALGGMTNPEKVISFLDIFGNWDPSLAFVMGAGIVVYAPAFRLVTRRAQPVLDTKFHLPTRKDIDIRLVAGAILFGIGWGMGGFCPGPAIVSTMSFGLDTTVFAASMVAGMLLFALWSRRVAKAPTSESKNP